MDYYSTRMTKKTSHSAAEAIKMGLAHDGGLFVPSGFPAVTADDLSRMAKESYPQRAAFIMGKFLTDYSAEELLEASNLAYTKEKFETDSIAPVYKLNPGTYALELWHGPTCAFKDVALQVLPYLLRGAMEKTFDVREILILTATSGDTGKAALEGFRDVSKVWINVFYPATGVSHVQKLQMITQEGHNVRVCGINGNFDDAQTAVKSIFNDEQYRDILNRKGYVLSSANSINWGRLVPQIAYYFSAYCELLDSQEIKRGEKINFVVPTGNFGNILSAYYAKKMGLPVNKLICASNKNNVLTDFFRQGEYSRNRDFFVTASPSMDILISSNLERLLYEAAGGDAEKVCSWMAKLSTDGTYKVTDEISQFLKNDFWAAFCNDSDTAFTIKYTFDNYGYLMDPHTAVAKNVHDQYIEETGDGTKTVIASTASPFKFGEFVCRALGEDVDGKSEMQLLTRLAEISDSKLPYSLRSLDSRSIRFDRVCNKEEIKGFVDELFIKTGV